MFYSCDLNFYKKLEEFEKSRNYIIMFYDEDKFLEEYKKYNIKGNIGYEITSEGHSYNYFNIIINKNEYLVTYEIDDIFLNKENLFSDIIGIII